MTLSVTIITLNAADTIRACLESIKWAHDIVVLDSGSTDDTIAICKEYTNRIFLTDWPGFGKQKNRALDYATQPWILSLDADEALSLELQFEIQTLIKNSSALSGYAIKRESLFMGKIIRHGNWGSDCVMRLCQQGAGRFTDDVVHETLQVNGAVSVLKNVMYHHTATSIELCLEKLNRYSTLNAEKMVDQGKKATISQAIIHGFWTFIRAYFLRAGFLDGREGYLIACLSAQASFYKYVKCFYLGKHTSL